MGFQSAANAAAGGTQQSMIMQALAAQQQQQAIQQGQQQAAAALQQGQTQGAGALGQYYGAGVGYQQPYMAAGTNATNQLAALFGDGGAYTQQPTLEQLQMDPGYAFRFQQGQQALNAGLGSSGMRGSGAALKAATRYGQEAGSQEYQNAYARFMANRAAATQGLQNLAGTGAGAANISSGLAGQTGANLANLYSGTGANLANVYTGGANQLANVYGNLGQGLGQGAANIGSIYGQAAMAPINALSSLGGQAMQAAAMAYGGGLGGGLGGLFGSSAAPAGYVRYNPGVNMGPPASGR